MVRGVDGSEATGTGLIGADGLWSTLRPLIAPGASLHFTGATAWRSLLPRDGLPAPFDAPAVGLWLGPRAHLVHYPVRGGRELNVVAVTEGGAASQGWNQPASVETLLAGFTRWCKDSKSLLERAAAWRSWSLYRLDRLRRSAKAASPFSATPRIRCLPYLAQGAALAIEDAATLAAAIGASPGDPAAGLSPLRTSFAGRAPSRVQRLSRRIGTDLSPRRNAAARPQPRARTAGGEAALTDFDWLYGTSASRRTLGEQLTGYGLSFSASSRCCLITGSVLAANCFNACVVAALGVGVEQLRPPCCAP